MIYVDQALWPWRGERWAHLISDTNVAELHDFAEKVGKRRPGFQGDHYDVTTAERERCLAAGAQPLSSRELVNVLNSNGLRQRQSLPKWDLRHDQSCAPTEVAVLLNNHIDNPQFGQRLKAAFERLLDDSFGGLEHHWERSFWQQADHLKVLLLERSGEAVLLVSRSARSDEDLKSHQPLGQHSLAGGSALGISEVRLPTVANTDGKATLGVDLLVRNKD